MPLRARSDDDPVQELSACNVNTFSFTRDRFGDSKGIGASGLANDPYRILGLNPGATEVEINRAYRRLAKTFHPDLNPGRPDMFLRFNEITWARECLNDPEQRAANEANVVAVDDDFVVVTPI